MAHVRGVPGIVAGTGLLMSTIFLPARTDAAASGSVRSAKAGVMLCLGVKEPVKRISFTDRSKEHVKAVVMGSGSSGIVLSNQTDTHICDWWPLARMLKKNHFQVLLYEYVSYDASEAPAGAQQLLKRGAKRVALVGASIGGTVSLVAARLMNHAPYAVVDLSGPVSLFGVNALPAVRHLRMPTLFVASKYDTEFAADTRILYRASVSRHKRLLMLVGSEHGVSIVIGGVHARKAQAEVLRFLR